MPQHLEFSQHMKEAPEHQQIAETFLGQAHIAGTGPEGKTCRECVFWYCMRWSDVHRRHMPSHPKRYSKSHPDHGEPMKARCNRPIINKANRMIPHFAKACRLFEQDENPMPVRLEE